MLALILGGVFWVYQGPLIGVIVFFGIALIEGQGSR